MRISPLLLPSLLLSLALSSLPCGSRAQQQLVIHPERAPPALPVHDEMGLPPSEALEPAKNHLRGDSALPPSVPRPLPTSESMSSGHRVLPPQHLPTPAEGESRRVVPSAVAPPLDVLDFGGPSFAASPNGGPLKVTQVISSPSPMDHHLPLRPQQRRKPVERLVVTESPQEDGDAETEAWVDEPSQRRRLERIQARWRKLGPLLSANRASVYQRMRLVQHQRRLATIGGMSSAMPTTVSTSTTPVHLRSPLPTAAPPSSNTDYTTPQPPSSRAPLPGASLTDAVSERVNSRFYTPAPRHLPTAAITSTTSRLMWVIENHSADVTGSRQESIVKPKQLPTPPNGVRRQPPQIEINRGALEESDESGPSEKAKAFSFQMLQQQRLRHTSAPPRTQAFAASSRLPKNSIISGPVLAPPPSDDNSGDGVDRQFAENIVVSSERDPLALLGGDLQESREDTHHHRRGVIVEKKFRLVPNRVGPRPRLRIRRPGESAASIQGPQAAENPEGEFSNFDKAPFTFNNRVPERRYPERRIPLPAPSPPPSYPVLPSDPNAGRGGLPITSAGRGRVATPDAVLVHGASQHPFGAQAPPVPPVQPQPSQRVPVRVWHGEEHGSVGEQPPQPSPPLSTPSPPRESPTTSASQPPQSSAGEESSGPAGDSGLAFGQELGTPPPGFHEAFGLNGDGGTSFTASLGPPGGGGKARTETVPPTTTKATTRAPSVIDENFVIPENSGLRPVQPPKEFLVGGFGSKSSAPGPAFPSPYTGGDRGRSLQVEPPPPPSRTPPPPPASPTGGDAPDGGGDIFTGDSAFTPNKKGPAGDGYGPAAFPGVAAPPAEVSSAARPIGQGGGAAGLPLPSRPQPPPLPSPLVSDVMHMRPMANDGTESFSNQATTVKPSALLNILTKADEGFNQVITHFEQGTPIETAAIDLLEVALGSQKLDSQAKLLSHVDRAIGLENIQRLQRWANTGGALDMLKEQLAKVVKNYKPLPAAQAFTVPPQLEYLFQSG